jgi:acetyl esterase/lipase
MSRRRYPLLRAVAELVDAANGVQPIAREGYLTLPVFAFGWPTSEMSPMYLAVSMLDAGRRGLRGDFRGARGRIALLLNVIAWCLLWLIHRRNVASQPHFQDPLREALGEDYGRVANWSQPARRRRVQIGVWPTDLVRRRYVEKAGTVRYGPHRVNRADIWRRPNLPRDGMAPVLLQVPGGAWTIGMRRPQSYPLLSHMADRAWVCVSVDYRVSPRHSWPDHIVDVKRALVAAVPIYGRYDWVSTQGNGRKEFIGFLQKLVVKKRFVDNRQVYLDASSIKQVRLDAPPFFILHGQDDSIIPVPEGRDFAATLRAVSTSTVAYAEIPHAQHAFDFYYGSPRAHYTAQAVEEFLSWVHAMRHVTAHDPDA